MEPLNYHPSSTNGSFFRDLKKVLFWLMIAAITTATVVVLLIAWKIHDIRAIANAFDAKTSSAKLVGMTPQQIIALLGPPMTDTRTSGDTNQDCTIAYEDNSGEICRIEITKGAASNIEHYAK
jgi:hypothetical protein